MNDTAPITRDAAGEPTNRPQPKVIAATIGAGVGVAVSTVTIYVIETAAQLDIPDPVEAAAGVIITAALTYAAGWLKRPAVTAS